MSSSRKRPAGLLLQDTPSMSLRAARALGLSAMYEDEVAPEAGFSEVTLFTTHPRVDGVSFNKEALEAMAAGKMPACVGAQHHKKLQGRLEVREIGGGHHALVAILRPA